MTARSPGSPPATVPPVGGPTLRPLAAGDLAAVAAIEAAVSLDPWSEELFAGELAAGPTDRRWLVALDPSPTAPVSGVIGFGGVLHVAEEVHVMNLAVAPGHQCRGIATRLLAQLLVDAVDRGAVAATLEVRPSNVAAQALYQRFGFGEVGRRPRYYVNGDDAVIMWAHRLHRPEYRRRLEACGARP